METRRVGATLLACVPGGAQQLLTSSYPYYDTVVNLEAELDTQLKTWGNSFGIVIPKATAEKVGLEPGMPIHVTLSFEPHRNDASRLPTWDFPYRPVREILDEEAGKVE